MEIDPETLALVRHHARAISGWDVTTCDPVLKVKQKDFLRGSAERLLGLVYSLVGRPVPLLEAPKPKRRKPVAKRKRR